MTKKQLKSDLEALGYSMFKSTAPEGGLIVYKNCEYVCTIHWTKSKLTFNGKSYTNVEKMMEDVAKYNETLEFPANTYCPIYTKESVTSMRLYKTLKDCGFTRDAGIDGAYGADITVHSDGVMGAHFGTIVDNHMALGDYRWIEMYDRHDDSLSDHDKCDAIRRMTNILYVANLSILAAKISQTRDLSEEIKSIPITVADPKTLDVKTYEGIDGVIELLETTLKKLKKQS